MNFEIIILDDIKICRGVLLYRESYYTANTFLFF